MNCEVLAIGTELLLGQIVDTNSSWIGEQLALTGIDCVYQAKVGDNRARIHTALEHALERADAVIVCGGLGPTQDDITRDVVAEVMGVPLIRDEAIEVKIRAMFGTRGRDMPANNLRQADVPQGASVMAQQPGTAPGLICPIGDKVIYAVPGVPYEMKEMVTGTVLPDLARRAGLSSVIRSRTLRTWGQSESGLAEMLAITESSPLLAPPSASNPPTSSTRASRRSVRASRANPTPSATRSQPATSWPARSGDAVAPTVTGSPPEPTSRPPRGGGRCRPPCGPRR